MEGSAALAQFHCEVLNIAGRLLEMEVNMHSYDTEDTKIYNVVVNEEDQYSIWPLDKNIPAGWREVGRRGSKQECLNHINEVWTDMRPLSLRKRMENMETRRGTAAETSEGSPASERPS